MIIHRFVLSWRYIAYRLEQAAVVEPIYPFECCVLDLIDVTPRTTFPDHFGLVQTVDRFGQRVIVTVADTSNGCGDTGLRQALAVTDRKILCTAVAVVNEIVLLTACVDRLFQCIQHQIGFERG